MIIKKKLRDVTEKEYKKYQEHCGERFCPECPVNQVVCSLTGGRLCWINHKDLYSDKFLNQEIEIEMPDILDDIEKRYLSNIIKPFRDRVICIEKSAERVNTEFEYITLSINSLDTENVCEDILLPLFKQGTMYQNMEKEKQYTLEDLGL